MTDMDNRRQAIAGYALIGGFVALFIVLNWAGPGRVLSLVSAVAVVVTLLAIRTRSRLAVTAAVILLVTLPFVALRTHAGSAVGAIGPLVIPHETPCVTCLQGRLRERWGEREPVADPEVTRRYPDLVAALLASEVRRCLEGDTSLVGWTVAWNLADRSILREKLLTVPLCDYCRGIDLPGSITP